MYTQPFGSTSLTVTPIGLGLAALGRPGYITLNHGEDISNTEVEAMEQHAHSVLDVAWAAGIRYFDAARSYGRAELFLSNWLDKREIDLASVVVGSKWGYTYTADWQVEAEQHEIKDHSLAVLDRQWGETRWNLGSYLNVYQIHSATLASGVLTNTDVLKRLAELKAAGTVIGLSLSGAAQGETLRRAMDVSDGDGEMLFGSVQATWNVLEPSAGAVLDEAYQRGMGVIVKEVVANGRLTAKNAENPEFAEAYALLQAEAERLETTVDALAIAAALNQSWAGIVLSGASTPAQLASNVAAVTVGWDEQAAERLGTLAEDPVCYWQTRSNLAWN